MNIFKSVQVGTVSSDETSRYVLDFNNKQPTLQGVIDAILEKSEFGSIRVLPVSYGEFVITEQGYLTLVTHKLGNGEIKYANGVSYFEPPKQVPDTNKIPTYEIDYDKDKVKLNDIPKNWFDLPVILGTSIGGWGQMNYTLIVID